MDGLADEGFIIMGGPLADGRTLLAVRARSDSAVRHRFDADPWTAMGLLSIASVEAWTILLPTGNVGGRLSRRLVAASRLPGMHREPPSGKAAHVDVPPAAWLHHAVRIGPSPIEGRGLFATGRIATGAAVARLGGRLVTRTALEGMFAEAARSPSPPYIDCVSVEAGIDLVLDDPRLHYGNHSCDPNVWHVGAFSLVARKDIAAGDEIVVDYGTQTDSSHFAMRCRCGSALCRGTVTGLDWQRTELQARYGDHWVPVLNRRIATALTR